MARLFSWLNATEQRKGWRIALIALIVLSSGLGLRDPWPPSEPTLALMARDMVRSGDWLIPALAGQPFANHPPLGIWLIAAFYSATDSLRLSVLLPSLLASLGTLWLVYDLAAKLWGGRAGRLAAMALLCSFQFILQAHRGQVDAVLMFFVTLGVYGLLHYMLLQPARRWLTLAGVAMGLGVLTKGVGYLPLLLLLPYTWMRLQKWPQLADRPPLRQMWPLLSSALIPVLAWTLPALGFVSGADDQALDGFRRELLVNLAGGADLLLSAEPRAWWYLVVQALVLWLPLSLLLPWKLKVWRERLRVQDAAIGLLLAFVLLTILFFSVLPGKHGVQLLPALPAVALLVAPYLGGLWWRPGVQRASWAILLGVASVLITAGVVATQTDIRIHPDIPQDIPDPLWSFVGLLGGLALAVILLVRGRQRALGLPIFFFVGWFALGWYGYVGLNELRSPAMMLQQVGARVSPQGEVGMLDWRPRFSLYDDVRVVPIRVADSADAIAAARDWAAAADNRWLLLSRIQAESVLFADWTRFVYRYDDQQWALMRPAERGFPALPPTP